jgi:hypothetical protein
MVRTMPAAQETELERLEKENRQLNDQVASQAWELSLLRARFARYETALRGSQVTVYTQDRDLRYISISNSMLAVPPRIFLAAPIRKFSVRWRAQ